MEKNFVCRIQVIEMRHIRKKTLRRIALILGILLLFAAALFGVKLYLDRADASRASAELTDLYAGEDVPRVYYNDSWYKQKDSCSTFLLMGVDDTGEQRDYGSNINHAQADFLMLFVLDNSAQSYTEIQLNRDTMTPVNVLGTFGDSIGKSEMQLALSHTYGSGLEDSCENTVAAVSDLLFGTRIDHYAALSMDAIGIMNDQVGGVTVTIPVDMTMVDPAFQANATVKLNAEQAERFVRARYYLEDSTNLARMERQKLFITSWKSLALERADTDLSFALDLISDLSDYLVSDMNGNQLSDLANLLITYQDRGIVTTEGGSITGEEDFVEFYPDQDALMALVVDLFYEEDADFQPQE